MADKRVMRRLAALPIVMAGLVVVGVGLGVWANWRQPTGIIVSQVGIALAFSAFCYLGGPAARVVVTHTSVTVDNTFVRYEVPRGAALGFDVEDMSGVVLRVRDRASINVRAAMPPMVRPTAQSLRSLRQQARELSELLAQVPAVPGNGTAERQWRSGNVVLLAAAAIGAIAVFAYVFTQPS